MKSLINSIVSKEDKVEEITLLNPYIPQKFSDEKTAILDIKAKAHNQKRFNIEIQIANEMSYDKRALFYWARLYAEQLKTGENYSSLSKTIGIHLLNFNVIQDDQYHHRFRLIDEKSGTPYFEDIELHTIELQKFESNIQQIQDLVPKIQSSLDIWLAFLTKHNLINKNALPPELNNDHLKKAMEVLEIMNLTEDERQQHDDHQKWLHIRENILQKIKMDLIEEGEKKGLKKGLKQGAEKGLKQGLEKGVEKGKKEKTKAIAINLLKQNVDHTIIASATGLSMKMILQLKNKL